MTDLPDKNFLIITSRGYPTGFFSLFFQVVGQLEVCEKSGTIPVIFFRKNCFFWEKDGWNGSRNPWEYYFHPPSGYSISDFTDVPYSCLESAKLAEFSNHEIMEHTAHDEQCPGDKRGTIVLPKNVTISNVYPWGRIIGCGVMEEKRHYFNSLINKHIKLREHIVKKIDDFVKDRFKEHEMLGLHIRGKEHEHEVAQYLRMKALPLNFYLREVDRYLKEHPEARIFLATDKTSFRKIVTEKYGERVICYDAVLSGNGEQTHMKFRGARIGEDVLIDSVLLSRCDFLVHGMSQVPYASLYFNPGLHHVDVQQKYRFWAAASYRLSSGGKKVLTALGVHTRASR